MSVFFRAITTLFFKRMLSDEFIFYLDYTRVDQTFSNSRNTNVKTRFQLYQEIIQKVFSIINNILIIYNQFLIWYFEWNNLWNFHQDWIT